MVDYKAGWWFNIYIDNVAGSKALEDSQSLIQNKNGTFYQKRKRRE